MRNIHSTSFLLAMASGLMTAQAHVTHEPLASLRDTFRTPVGVAPSSINGGARGKHKAAHRAAMKLRRVKAYKARAK